MVSYRPEWSSPPWQVTLARYSRRPCGGPSRRRVLLYKVAEPCTPSSGTLGRSCADELCMSKLGKQGSYPVRLNLGTKSLSHYVRMDCVRSVQYLSISVSVNMHHTYMDELAVICMYIHVHICVYIYTYMHEYIYTYTYIYVNAYLRIYTHIQEKPKGRCCKAIQSPSSRQGLRRMLNLYTEDQPQVRQGSRPSQLSYEP